MPKFTVTRLRDAFVVYEVEVEAEDAEDAWHIGRNAANLPWIKRGVNEYDYCLLGVVDEDGNDLIEPKEE